MMFILVILILLSFVIYILNCCCKVCQTDKRSKGWLIASKILLLIIFILFIAFIVFISLSEKNYNPVICSLMRLPAGSLEGFKDENNQFIGIKNILQAFSGLNDEIGTFVSRSTSFVDISNQNLEM